MSQIAASVAAMRSSFVAYLVWFGGVVLSTCGAMSVFGSVITGGRLPVVGLSLAALLGGCGLLFAAKAHPPRPSGLGGLRSNPVRDAWAPAGVRDDPP